MEKLYALTKLEDKTANIAVRDLYLINHLRAYIYQNSNTTELVIENLNDIWHETTINLTI